jgi:hypothetical protein
MGEFRRRCHERRRCRRHEREKVLATVHNRFEKEHGDDGGEVEKMHQSGNALALKWSSNNKIEQENKSKSEED